jgi:hypothetical protein
VWCPAGSASELNGWRGLALVPDPVELLQSLVPIEIGPGAGQIKRPRPRLRRRQRLLGFLSIGKIAYDLLAVLLNGNGDHGLFDSSLKCGMQAFGRTVHLVGYYSIRAGNLPEHHPNLITARSELGPVHHLGRGGVELDLRRRELSPQPISDL